jgi:cytochrome c556
MKHTLKIVVQITLVAIFMPAAANADDQDVIDYREHIMRTLDEQSAALGMILSTVVPGDNAVTHLQAIALTAQTALKAFEPKVLGGEAKTEVWSNWADFSERMNEFAQKATELAKVAKEKGYSDTLEPQIVEALRCKSCHEVYRNEKKK